MGAQSFKYDALCDETPSNLQANPSDLLFALWRADLMHSTPKRRNWLGLVLCPKINRNEI